MMHDSEPSEQDGGGKAAEDGIINLEVGDLRARAAIITSHLLTVLNWFLKIFLAGHFTALCEPAFCIHTEP